MDMSKELIVKQKLSNGFTYYIRKLEHFEKYVTMALTIKVGSINEIINERGLAHLLEHMHMNFHKYELYSDIRYRTKAYTDFFETTFYIKCFNSWENIISCMEIFSYICEGKFLNELYFTETKNDVISEILGYDENKEQEKNLFSILLANSEYMDCLAIGNIENVSDFSYQDLLEFHKKWYSADIMSIAIVGDVIDIREMEKTIKVKFEGIITKKLPNISFNPEIPKYDKMIFKNRIKESDKRGLEVYFKVKKSDLFNFNFNEIEVMESILFEMVEIKLKSYFKEVDKSLLEVTCEKINLDVIHMFYSIKIVFKDIESLTINDIVNLIEDFFNSIIRTNNDYLILDLLTELSDTIEKSKDNYYDSVGMHYLLLECINDYISEIPVVTYLEKYESIKNIIKKINLKNIYTYLNYWINECDRLYLEIS